jgi:hypothetical protein
MRPEHENESQSIEIELPRSLIGVVKPMTPAEVAAMHQRVRDKVKAYQQSLTPAPTPSWTMEEKLHELAEGFRSQQPSELKEA